MSTPQLWREGTDQSTKWWPDVPTTAAVKTHLEGLLQNDRLSLGDDWFFVLQTVLTGDTPMFRDSVIKVEIQKLLLDANTALVIVQGKLKKTGKSINKNKAKISNDKEDIKEAWNHIRKHPFDIVGNAKRVKQIADLEAEILVLKAHRKVLDEEASAERELINKGKDLVATLNGQLAEFAGVPTSLQELAAKGNPAMLGWLDEWKDSGLNIIIMDWAEDTDFIERVVKLNGGIQ